MVNGTAHAKRNSEDADAAASEPRRAEMIAFRNGATPHVRACFHPSRLECLRLLPLTGLNRAQRDLSMAIHAVNDLDSSLIDTEALRSPTLDDTSFYLFRRSSRSSENEGR